MTHLAAISAGVYSDLAFSVESVSSASIPADFTAWSALFTTELALGSAVTSATGEYRRIKNVREFPSLGTPANIVNVPVYGQDISVQVQGQADAPTIEITLNYVPSEWRDAANYLGNLVGKNTQYAFRFTLLNDKPATYNSNAAGLGAVANSQWFWIGRIEALVVNPQLTDAITATLTLSTQTDFYGAFTSDPA
jgi:hypothetical protein